MTKITKLFVAKKGIVAFALMGLAFCILCGCSESDLKKLKAKAMEADREADHVQKKWDNWHKIIDTLRQEEKENPNPTPAKEEKREGAKQVRESIRLDEDKLLKKVDEIIKELGELSSGNLQDALDWAVKNLPDLVSYLEKKGIKIKGLSEKTENTKNKVSQMGQIMDNAERIVKRLTTLKGTKKRARLIEQLDLELVRAAQVNLIEEQEALAELVRVLDVDAFPIVPNTVVERLIFAIKDFRDFPPFEELSDGELRAGTVIDIFLPEEITLIHPVTFSSKFALCIIGNEPGSRHIHAEIVSGEDTEIILQFNGINIGNLECGKPVYASMSVIPGKITKQQILPICP